MSGGVALLVWTVALVVACAAVGAEPHSTAARVQVRYYVALGDSVAAGTQPGRLFSAEGYPEQLVRLQRRRFPRLRLVKLACPGETTGALRRGGRCPYPRGSQLAQAVAFLRTNRGRVAFVTVGIGANDLLVCGAADAACAARALAEVRRHLPPILTELRRAAGGTVPIVGMDYYAPLLARWLDGPDGERAAREHVTAVVQPGNALLRSTYRRRRARVARVEAAFATADFATADRLPDARPVPRNVARVCRLTWMCSRRDVHPNAEGHRVIARAFAAALRR